MEEWLAHAEPVESGEAAGESEEHDAKAVATGGARRRTAGRRVARLRPVAWIERLAELSYARLIGVWLGMVFGLGIVYWLIGQTSLGALRESDRPLAGGVHGLVTAFYFSLVTATSIGFGDVVPVGLLRLVAVLEGGAALLVFGCLVSKLVSRHQEELAEQTHSMAFEAQLGRVRTNLHLVLSELQAIESSLGERNQALGLHDPALAHTLSRLESAAMVFSGELRAVHDLLYRPHMQPEEAVIEGLLASIAASLEELKTLFERIPDARRRSALLDSSVEGICTYAGEICGECVPRAYAPELQVWMNRIQDLARGLSREPGSMAEH
jgi:Ion channel